VPYTMLLRSGAIYVQKTVDEIVTSDKAGHLFDHWIFDTGVNVSLESAPELLVQPVTWEAMIQFIAEQIDGHYMLIAEWPRETIMKRYDEEQMKI
jgi:hypothetical protein